MDWKNLLVVLTLIVPIFSVNLTRLEMKGFEDKPDTWTTMEGYEESRRNLGVCTHKNEKFFKNFNANPSDFWPTGAAVVRENPKTFDIYVGFMQGYLGLPDNVATVHNEMILNLWKLDS